MPIAGPVLYVERTGTDIPARTSSLAGTLNKEARSYLQYTGRILARTHTQWAMRQVGRSVAGRTYPWTEMRRRQRFPISIHGFAWRPSCLTPASAVGPSSTAAASTTAWGGRSLHHQANLRDGAALHLGAHLRASQARCPAPRPLL